ncbi:MAG TPA: serine O-acetyltransferase EpsC [Chthoniobacterales bacterium]
MDKSIALAVMAVLESYRDDGGINNIDGSNLPSKRAVAEICEDLLEVLFPGFHDEGPIPNDHLRELTTARLENVSDRLREEIFKSLRTKKPSCPTHLANTAMRKFLDDLPRVRQLLRTDVEAAYEGDPASTSYEEIIVSYPSVEAIAIQRMAHNLYRQEIPLLPRIMTEWAHSRTGIDIHPGAEIGAYFFIDHGTGVVVGETCRIGSRVKLYHGVTLGARSFQKDEQGKIKKGGKRHPDVEDGVTIYPNATILGGETVMGARSTIGGNVFIMESVPPDSLVTNERSQVKVVSKKHRLELEGGASLPSAQSAEFNYEI